VNWIFEKVGTFVGEKSMNKQQRNKINTTKKLKNSEEKINMKKLTTLAVAAVVALTAVTSQAAIIVAGGSLTGQNLIQTSPLPAPGVGTLRGTVSSWVISGYSGNLLGLTFVYQVTGAAAQDDMNFASFNGFSGGVVTSAGVAATSGFFDGLAFGAVPSGSANGVYLGTSTAGSASFNGSDLGPSGGTSQFLYVNTTATTFSKNVGHAQDTFQAEGATLAPVPEPSTVVAGALLLLPLGASALRVIRKNRTA